MLNFHPSQPAQFSAAVDSYLSAALEHLIFWSDLQAPLVFHQDQSNEVTLRPSYTLARAAIEAASQAVWLMDTTDPMECIRRHVCLIRWDLQEQRKSQLDLVEKEWFRKREEDLVQRVSKVFEEEQVRPPSGYLAVIRSACAATGIDLVPDAAERLWRAASGVAHGKHWPTVELQREVSVDEAQPGTPPSVVVPDVDRITEVLRAGYTITQVGVLRFLDYSGADIALALEHAKDWLATAIPLKDGVDREAFVRALNVEGTTSAEKRTEGSASAVAE